MTQYPDLSDVTLISFDSETHDPNLSKLGPGVYREDGKILGVSLGTPDGFSEYYNLGHYDCDASERQRNISYLREVLGNDVPKIGQSIIYDIDWLENGEYKIPIRGKLASIEIAEALLDETQEHYNMDFMGHKYLGIGKEKTDIDRFCEENGLKGDSRAWLWKMPYKLVRPYACKDAELPIRIFDKQLPMLKEQGLIDLFDLECELVRVLVKFRKTGVRIDEVKRKETSNEVRERIRILEADLFNTYGTFNCNSSQQVAKIMDRIGFKYAETEKGNPSINAYFYKRHMDENETIKKIHDLKQMRHNLETFIDGSHVRFVCPDGLIHAQFYNLRNDNLGSLKGTRSGRLSGANPNLQQQPSTGTDEYWGRKCRGDFIPFDDCWWGKIDYSQIEYRFMAHFALGEGSDELRLAYNTNPKTDYHQFIVDLTGLTRRYAKNLNFGVAFGMGVNFMSEYFGWDLDYCKEIRDIYFSRAPYIKATMQKVEEVARRRGYIKTFLGRRSRLKDPDKAYTMYCRLVQGSAADLMKKAMVTCWHDGLFDVLYPHMTVHDELDVSIPKTKAGLDAFKEMQHIMETCLTIQVPILAEAEIGPNWADVDEVKWDELYREVDQ